MKVFRFIISMVAVSMLLSSFCIVEQGTASSDPQSILSSVLSSGTSSGQAAGAALKSLYTQYKADGKLDMKNVKNIASLTTLAKNLQGLKGQSNKSQFYKDFATGLVKGSNNLVNKTNSSSVMSGLSNIVNNVDLSSLVNGASSTASTSKGVENASEIASSVTKVLNLFK
ncbi:MAG: hypothetical protein ACI4TU_08910 [Candidatus Cryptobacteroides sp.]